jgi:hypothetical protein
VILFRCFPWDERVEANARGGVVWFPRMLQGLGRHDNPDVYGCLYTTEEPVSAVVEQLAALTGTSLEEADLVRGGRRLALGALELPDDAEVVDLDEPRVLAAEELRPSLVATNRRAITRAGAAELHARHPRAAGIRWWSTFEAMWPNVTLFDRAAAAVAVRGVQRLGLGDDIVADAARFLGLRVVA